MQGIAKTYSSADQYAISNFFIIKKLSTQNYLDNLALIISGR